MDKKKDVIVFNEAVNIIESQIKLKKAKKTYKQFSLKFPRQVIDKMELSKEDKIRIILSHDGEKMKMDLKLEKDGEEKS